jgi:type II secretory pathway component PulL
MTKRNRIIYWISTVWLALGMVSTGLVQLLRVQDEVDNLTYLGYPIYLYFRPADRKTISANCS